jgi:prepilin-type N-terminal cleavage/methylation domain-containing protein
MAGFTLVEVTMAVAVAGALAAVVLPQFLGSAKRAKYDTEVNAVFAEIAAREEQLRTRGSSAYFALESCSSATGCDDWSKLGVTTAIAQLSCRYEVHTGCRGEAPEAPGVPGHMLAQSWYFVVAICGEGSDAATTYVSSSVSSTIAKYSGVAEYTPSTTCSVEPGTLVATTDPDPQPSGDPPPADDPPPTSGSTTPPTTGPTTTTTTGTTTTSTTTAGTTTTGTTTCTGNNGNGNGNGPCNKTK